MDGEEKEEEIFKKYRAVMDLEFPNRSVTNKAQIGDDHWLICPVCIDAWEDIDAKQAMVICPKCHEIFQNPRYIDVLPSLTF